MSFVIIAMFAVGIEPVNLMPKRTEHERVEAELTVLALRLPETDRVPWGEKRVLRVKTRTFVIFGGQGEARNALTLTVKLPLSFEMIQDLPFVLPSSGWHLQHKWATARFGPGDQIAAELDMLRGWVLQSYQAMAPKRLAKLAAASP